MAFMYESDCKRLWESCQMNEDSNFEVYDVSDCLESEGIEIVSTKEENDMHQDSSVRDVSVVNKADKMKQKGKVGNGMIDISIGLMGIRVMNCDDKGVEDICEENVEGVGMELDANSCLGNIDKGEVKNKSEVIVDEFVHNDGNSEDIEAIWKW
ncbi:hypothetical protein Tco_0259265, partial [Tanacetum coccineum]